MSLSALCAALGLLASQACALQAALDKVLAGMVPAAVQKALPGAFEAAFQKAIIPAFEAACQTMFKEVGTDAIHLQCTRVCHAAVSPSHVQISRCMALMCRNLTSAKGTAHMLAQCLTQHVCWRRCRAPSLWAWQSTCRPRQVPTQPWPAACRAPCHRPLPSQRPWAVS